MLIGVVCYPRRGLPLARDRLLPCGQVRQLLEPVRHRLGAPLRQILVVRIISHVVGVTRDRELPTRGVLLDLLHHIGQHGISLGRELIGVSLEGDIPIHRHRRRLLILLRVRRTVSRKNNAIHCKGAGIRLIELRLGEDIINRVVDSTSFHNRNPDRHCHLRHEQLNCLHTVSGRHEDRKQFHRLVLRQGVGEPVTPCTQLREHQPLLHRQHFQASHRRPVTFGLECLTDSQILRNTLGL